MASDEAEHAQLLMHGAEDILAPARGLNRLSDCIVQYTPKPLAASTVYKRLRGCRSDKFLMDSISQGSFIEEPLSSTSHQSGGLHRISAIGCDDQQANMTTGMPSFNMAHSLHDDSYTSDRSSLGLLNLDAMGDLSENLLDVPMFPTGVQNPALNRDGFYRLSNYGSEAEPPAKSQENGANLSHDSLLSGTSLTGTLTSQTPTPGPQTLSGLWLSGKITSTVPTTTRSAFVDTPRPEPLQHQTLVKTSKVSQCRSNQDKSTLGQTVDIAAGGMLFGNQGDLDMSVVDVEINDDELNEFDEEFSDLCDMDTTLADESMADGCDLRTELLVAEQSMREEEECANDQPGLEEIDPEQTPTVPRSMPVLALSLEGRPQTTGQADYSDPAHLSSSCPIDPRLLRKVTPDPQGSSGSNNLVFTYPNGNDSINFAASLRNKTQQPQTSTECAPSRDDSINFAASLRNQAQQPQSSSTECAPSGNDSINFAASLCNKTQQPQTSTECAPTCNDSINFAASLRNQAQPPQSSSTECAPSGNDSINFVASLRNQTQPVRPYPAEQVLSNTEDCFFGNDSINFVASLRNNTNPSLQQPVAAEHTLNAMHNSQDSELHSQHSGQSSQLSVQSKIPRLVPTDNISDLKSSQDQSLFNQTVSTAGGMHSPGATRESLALSLDDLTSVTSPRSCGQGQQENRNVSSSSTRQVSGQVLSSKNTRGASAFVPHRLESQREKDWGDVLSVAAAGGRHQRNPRDHQHVSWDPMSGSRDHVMPGSNTTSLIDTDDEITAVRQENAPANKQTRRQRGVGSGNMDSDSSRPGLEGGSSEENETPAMTSRRLEARQSAEGDIMTSPVVGDGGGGGDGSSGHGSDDGGTRAAIGGAPSVPVSRTRNRQAHADFEEDNPDAQERIRPMGDDLLSEMVSSQRHTGMQFSSPANIREDTRGRTLSGASDGSGDDSDHSPGTSTPDTQDSDAGEDETDAITDILPQKVSFGTINDFPHPPAGSPNNSVSAGATFLVGASGGRWSSRDGHVSLHSRDSSHPEDDTRAKPQAPDNPWDGFGNMGPNPFDADGEGFPAFPEFPTSSVLPSASGGFPSDGGGSSFNIGVPANGEYPSFNGEVRTDGGFLSAVDGFPVADADDLGWLGFGDDDFVSADQGLALIAEDEEEIERENRFVQPETLPDHNTTLGLPDSWTYLSALDITVQSSWGYESGASHVSVGTFMATRSGALGSLDGRSADQRPSIGSGQIMTPPRSHHPPVLLRGASSLSDINEQTSWGGDDIRGSGVGSDIDIDAGSERTLQTEDLVQSLEARSTQSSGSRPVMGDGANDQNDSRSCSNSPERPLSAADRSTDVTTAINISTINKLILSSSSKVKPAEFAEMIMKMSSQKLGSQKSKTAMENGSAGNGGVGKKVGNDLKNSNKSSGSSAEQCGMRERDRLRKGLSNQRKPDGNGPVRQDGAQQRARSPGNLRRIDKKDDLNGESSSPLRCIPSGENVMVSSNGNTHSAMNRSSLLPKNGHAKVPLCQGNDRPPTDNIDHEEPIGPEKSKERSNELSMNRECSRENGKPGRRVEDAQRTQSNPQEHYAFQETSQRDRVGSLHHSRIRPPRSRNETRPGSSQRQPQNENCPLPTKGVNPTTSRPQASLSASTWLSAQSTGKGTCVSRNSGGETYFDDNSYCPTSNDYNDFDQYSSKQTNSKDCDADGRYLYKEKDQQGERASKINYYGNDRDGLTRKNVDSQVQVITTDMGGDEQETDYKKTTRYGPDAQEIGSGYASMESEHVQFSPPQWKSPRPSLMISRSQFADDSDCEENLLHEKNLVIGAIYDIHHDNVQEQQSGPKMPADLYHDHNISNNDLRSMSVVSDQFNVSGLAQNRSRCENLQSTSVLSDTWSMAEQDDKAHHKENQPPRTDQKGSRRLEMYPVSHAPTAFSKKEESLLNSYHCSSFSSPKSIPSKEIMPSSRNPLTHVTVEVPLELRVPKVCCVGLSVQAVLPLTNPSDRWLHVHLKVITLEVNSDSYDPDKVIPFVMKEKVIIEPQMTEEVKVIFSPKLAGVYVGQLHVIASPVWSDQPVTTVHVPAMVTLQGIAETPNIEVLTHGDGSLSFGALQWGSQKSLHMMLANRGQASIPVRLAINSDNSSSPCFTFEKRGTGNTSIISLTRPLNAPTVPPSVINCMLPSSTGRDATPNPVPVTMYFRAPSRQLDRVSAMEAPEEYSARLDIEVDTPSAPTLIKSLRVMAVVGTTRLHAPINMSRVVQFVAEVGSSQTHTIPLRNVGNLLLELSVEVTHWPEYFSVTPPLLCIPAGGQEDIQVHFKPTKAGVTSLESVLLMFVEPGGSGYEISLCGQVQAPVPRPLPTVRTAAPPSRLILMSNKSFLAWGGVPLGHSLQQSVTVQNNSNNQVKIKLQIRGDSHEFQLHSQYGTQQKLTDVRVVMLHPHEEYNVHVLFTPSRRSHFSGKLSLKPANSTIKYTIPLCGYGGISSLILEGVEKGQSTSYWHNLGPLSTERHFIVKAVVCNTGTRMAFVKGLGFRDLGCRHRLSEVSLTVQPSEFCLPPDCAQPITMILKPSDKDVVMCLDQSSIISTVALFYGDEVSRQKLRRVLVRKGGLVDLKLSGTNPVQSINFNVHYAGEEMCNEDDFAPETPSDVDLFYSAMSKTLLALIGEPQPGSLHEIHAKPVPDLLPSTVTGTVNLFSTSKGSPIAPSHGDQADKPLRQPCPLPEDWCIKPEQLILTASSKDQEPVIKRIQLISYSQYPLNFELLWPGRVLTVTPDQGMVPPRSSTSICISANSTLRAKGVSLPWRGHVCVDCEGQSKVIKVQVREDTISDDSTQLSIPVPLALVTEAATQLVTITTPGPSQQNDHLKLAHKTITFSDTVINRTSGRLNQQLNIDDE